jgi:hypothetical protein
MKGGADISDQLVISNTVRRLGTEVDVAQLAAELNIPIDCCQSYVDHFLSKHGLKADAQESKPVKRAKKEVAPAEAVIVEDSFFDPS